MLDRNNLKDWFRTRKKPTQSQFWQWIDACFFKGEKLPISDVDGLSNTLQNIQLNINSISPSKLISGGTIEILAQDETNVLIGIPQTSYEIRGVLYNVAVSQISIVRPTSPTVSRFDVFYLDAIGFNVKKGVESETPFKPQLATGQMELTAILVGYNNDITIDQPTGVVPTLQNVTAEGNVTTLPIVAAGFAAVSAAEDNLPLVGMSAENADPQLIYMLEAEGWISTKSVILKASLEDITGNREILFPDKSGTIALIEDLEGLGDSNYRGTFMSLSDVLAIENPAYGNFAFVINYDAAIKYIYIGGWMRSDSYFRGYYNSLAALNTATPGFDGKRIGDYAYVLQNGFIPPKVYFYNGGWTTADKFYGTHVSLASLGAALTSYGVTFQGGEYVYIGSAGNYKLYYYNYYSGAWVDFSGTTEFPLQDYTKSIIWTAASAPEGVANLKWRGQRVGNIMNLWIILNYPNPGATNVTAMEIPLPAGAPIPEIPSNIELTPGVFLFPANASNARIAGSTQNQFTNAWSLYKGAGVTPTIFLSSTPRTFSQVTLFTSYPCI